MHLTLWMTVIPPLPMLALSLAVEGDVDATIEALRMLEEPAAVAARRGLSMEDAIPAPLRGIQQKAGA